MCGKENQRFVNAHVNLIFFTCKGRMRLPATVTAKRFKDDPSLESLCQISSALLPLLRSTKTCMKLYTGESNLKHSFWPLGHLQVILIWSLFLQIITKLVSLLKSKSYVKHWIILCPLFRLFCTGGRRSKYLVLECALLILVVFCLVICTLRHL